MKRKLQRNDKRRALGLSKTQVILCGKLRNRYKCYQAYKRRPDATPFKLTKLRETIESVTGFMGIRHSTNRPCFQGHYQQMWHKFLRTPKADRA